MKFNVNHYVTLILTDLGMEILKLTPTLTPQGIKMIKDENSYILKKVTPEKKIRMQMHEAFRIFGGQNIGVSSLDIPFESEIEIEVEGEGK